MAPKEMVIEDIPLFFNLAPEEVEKLKHLLKERPFKKGETLFQSGDFCSNVFILKSGRLKMFRLSENGKEQILDIMEPGDTCACHPGLTSWHCNSFTKAIKDSVLWALNRDDFSKFISRNAILSINLNKIFAEKIQKFTTMIEDISLDDVRTRLIHFLLQQSKAHGIKTPKGSFFQLPFTRSELGSQLGAARETVTRCLYELKEKGWINIHGKQITITNAAQLDQACHVCPS